MTRLGLGSVLAALLALAACGPGEEILAGDRFDPRDITAAADALAKQQEAGTPVTPAPEPVSRVPIAAYAVTGEPRKIALPGAATNAEWTHVNGGVEHRIAHPALGPSLSRIWTASIGSPGTRRVRMSADPVVAAGKIFTLSAFSQLQATSTSGGVIWARDLTPSGERAGEAAGGGLAYAGGRIYAATGYGILHVLDATSGAVIWQQKLGSAPSGAPTVAGDLIYLTTRDSKAWAIDAKTGRVLWQLAAAETGSVVNTGAAPAVAGRTVLFPFGSGDMIAALREGGVQLWTSTVTGQRPGRAYTAVTDISGDPVVQGNTVYVGTPSGRLAALDLASGERIWTAGEGAVSAVWPAGGSVFLISDQAELVRLDAGSGEKIWSATLPLYTEEKIRRRHGVFAHFGPVLAGGRLIVASGDGMLREIDPASGQLLRATDLGAPAAANPVVAGQVLYVVTTNGKLHAFR
ncbi:MAG: PQQ-binding-like beta-propeller repeat protein [Rhodobacteraceae bacterium]|nr:PQQ-binding-like beta-propeller repeat protein [Paracoccaceae bacterium]